MWDIAEEAPPPKKGGKAAPAEKPAKVTASQDDIDDLLGDMDLSDKSEQTMVGFGEDLLNQIDDDDDAPVAPREKVAVAAPAPQQVRDHDATMEFEVLEGQEKPAGATGPGRKPKRTACLTTSTWIPWKLRSAEIFSLNPPWKRKPRWRNRLAGKSTFPILILMNPLK